MQINIRNVERFVQLICIKRWRSERKTFLQYLRNCNNVWKAERQRWKNAFCPFIFIYFVFFCDAANCSPVEGRHFADRRTCCRSPPRMGNTNLWAKQREAHTKSCQIKWQTEMPEQTRSLCGEMLSYGMVSSLIPLKRCWSTYLGRKYFNWTAYINRLSTFISQGFRK